MDSLRVVEVERDHRVFSPGPIYEGFWWSFRHPHLAIYPPDRHQKEVKIPWFEFQRLAHIFGSGFDYEHICSCESLPGFCVPDGMEPNFGLRLRGVAVGPTFHLPAQDLPAVPRADN